MTVPVLHEYDMGWGVTAFSSTRHGGVGKGNYSSFNINYYCGDRQEDIEANRRALCGLLGISVQQLVYPHQTHQTVVRAVDEGLLGLPEHERVCALKGVDAVMTSMKGVCVGVSTADCIPILLYDRFHQACCAVHAGWRGTVARVVQHALKAMSTTYGTKMTDITAVIGPGISLECFEVGDEVYEQFAQAGFDMQKIAKRYEKWHIDLWECNRMQMVEMGVSDADITLTGICTYTHYDDFFSARRMGINSGRIFSGIMLR